METKLCKDCKHCGMDIGTALGYGSAICRHPKAPIDLIYGHKSGSCELMRSTNCLIIHCGINGDWFEQAPPPEPSPLIHAKSYAGTYGGYVEDPLPPRRFIERFVAWIRRGLAW